MRYVIQEPKTEKGIRFVPMSDEVAECFRKVIAQRPAPENEPEIDGLSGFLYLDKNGMPLVALHWEHYFQRIVQVQLDLQGGDPQGDTSCLPSYVLQQPGPRRDESQGAPVRDGPQRNRGDAQHVHASWLRGGSRGEEPAIRLNMRGVRSSVLHHFLHRIGMKKPVRI